MNQRERISEILIALAEYYEKPLTELQLAMYVEDLLELDADHLLEAVKRYRKDPANEFFPKPAKLISMVLPTENLEADARDAAGRMVAAVSKFGPYQNAKAREYIGPLGWTVVDRQGGWEEVCSKLTYDNMGQMQAQWREHAIAIGRRAKFGLVDQAPALPGPSKPAGLRPLGQLLGEIQKGDGK